MRSAEGHHEPVREPMPRAGVMAPMSPPPGEKVCPTCGRRFEWRRKWADVWDRVKYCSRGCRGGPTPLDRRLETEVTRLLEARVPGGSICPSEVARRVFGDDWRRGMEAVRRAGRRLAHAGGIEVTQGGRVVDPSDARGAVRYRRRRG